MKSKWIALLFCLFTGIVGGHFIYVRRYHDAKVRFLWFFFCNPVAAIKTLIDLFKILVMNKYEFDTYAMPRVKGTGSKQELDSYLDNLKPKRNFLDTLRDLKKILRLNP